MAKRGRGRPKWVPDAVIIEKIREYAKTGATLEQIAEVIGIGKTTFHKALNEYAEIVNAVKAGRATAAVVIAGKLYESAKNGNTTAQIFYLKAQAGWRDRVEVSGDPSRPLVVRDSTKPLGISEVEKALAAVTGATKDRRSRK